MCIVESVLQYLICDTRIMKPTTVTGKQPQEAVAEVTAYMVIQMSTGKTTHSVPEALM